MEGMISISIERYSILLDLEARVDVISELSAAGHYISVEDILKILKTPKSNVKGGVVCKCKG